MTPDAYAQMFACEDSHWWYVGMHTIMSTILDRHVSWQAGEIRLLDVGCGTGGTLARVGEYAHASGVDVSPEALKFCRRRQLPRLGRATVEALPFRENAFDVVTCLDVLYHRAIVNDAQALSSIVHVLKPGGWLFIREPACDFLRGSLHDRAVHTARRYSAGELKRKLEAAGLCVRRMTYANTLLFPLVAAKRLVERRLPATTASASDPDLTFSPFNNLLSSLLKLEARLLKRINLPFGLSLIGLATKPWAAPLASSEHGVVVQQSVPASHFP